MKKILLIITICYLTIQGHTQTINAGSGHSIMLCSDSLIWTVGSNSIGQLGDNTTTTRLTPVKVNGLTDIIAIDGGLIHSIVLKNDGTVWTWGGNQYGQLGNGTTTTSLVPVQALGLSNIVKIIAGGYHNIAIRNDSNTWMWGSNQFKQINGGNGNKLFPLQTSSISNVVDVAAGDAHTVVLSKDSTILVWNNGITAIGLTGIISVSAGTYHFFAIKSDGTIWGWGENSYGQLGDSTTIDQPTPVQILGLNNIIDIDGGQRHSIALRSDSTVWTWGWNGFGQLGDNTLIDKLIPIQVLGIDSVIAIAAGAHHCMALRSDSTVWVWGYNISGQLGNDTATNTTIPIQMMLSCNFTCPTSQIFIGNDTMVCEGITLNADNYITYDWNNGLSNNQTFFVNITGTYYVTTSDSNDCNYNSDTITITVISPNVTITPNDSISFCNEDSIILNATIGFSNYNWSNGDTTQSITINQSGNYFTSIIDSNGCIANSDTAIIIASLLPEIFLGNDTIILSNESIILDAGSGFVYFWNDSSTNQTLTVSGLDLDTVTYIYYVTVTEINGCSNSDTISITINNITDIIESYINNNEIYPNPTTGIINIKGTSFEIFNSMGQIINKQITNGQIDLSGYKKGIYIVRINKIQTKKLIILQH